jgi:hypothetical protein
MLCANGVYGARLTLVVLRAISDRFSVKVAFIGLRAVLLHRS